MLRQLRIEYPDASLVFRKQNAGLIPRNRIQNQCGVLQLNAAA
jgi:hypothetical protein